MILFLVSAKRRDGVFKDILMFRIKNIVGRFKTFKNYMYYWFHSLGRNIYPSKIIGEKISHLEESLIIIKVMGQNELVYLPLNAIFSSAVLIASFSPKDTLKLGKLAFNQIIIQALTKEESFHKFIQIKEAMLTSSLNLYQFSPSHFHLNNLNPIQNEFREGLNAMIAKNKYPYKLVGQKPTKNPIDTTILYTIYGKREGYQKVLTHSVEDVFIEKFHPTEAIKIGFIIAGREHFPA